MKGFFSLWFNQTSLANKQYCQHRILFLQFTTRDPLLDKKYKWKTLPEYFFEIYLSVFWIQSLFLEGTKACVEINCKIYCYGFCSILMQ